MNPGKERCVSNLIRWYYDSADGACKEFTFKGCGGNQNNFKSKELCMETCAGEDVDRLAMEESQYLESHTLRNTDYAGDNRGLVSESLIKLTPEEERIGVFRPARLG